MDTKIEIKSHDGPGRLGKINKNMTPILVKRSSFNITESEPIPYDVDKELAQWAVEETLKKPLKIDKDKEQVAVIQGSRYIDLRIECASKLEKKGYNGLIIAHADELLLHPQTLTELIVKLRETLNPNTYLIFPFVIPAFIPLLAYMGIDMFFDDSAEYFSYNNMLLTPTKNYNLEKYEIYDLNQKELCEYNYNTLDLVLREVREHMKNGTLRNLVEERADTSPQNTSTLRLLDKNHSEYLDKYTQLY